MSHIRFIGNILRHSAHLLLAGCVLENVLVHSAAAQANAVVTAHLTVRGADGKSHVPSANMPVVLWLSPVGADGQIDRVTRPGIGKSFEMVQKGKMFQPHLLVVATGSLVAFPNRDPFFHNVFSLFNGRRFDLGLYETGASHAVPFNREGVSYIFCNIHPEMGAVVVSIATPYFAVATQATVQLHAVPPGSYQLQVWAEDAASTSLESASRRVQVGEGNIDLGMVDIRLQPSQVHTDKFGKPYTQHPDDKPY